MEIGTFVSLGAYFLLMLGIGFYAYRTSTGDTSEYMLGGRKLGPAVTSLSAGASDMSGWMLLGLPGAAFVSGLPATWIAIGLTLGAFANYLVVAPRLRLYTERADDALTIPDYFEKRFHDNTHILRVFSSVVIVLFFTLYTSATLVGGGKLFESAFGQDYITGLWITAGVVMAYTFVGGFLAVSLTDFVQGCIMFIALLIVPIAAFTQLGDNVDLAAILADIGPALSGEIAGGLDSPTLNLFAGASFLGTISLLAWGLGYFGQPHIIVRFMAIRSVADVPMARHIGMSWMIVALIGSVSTGLIGLAYIAQNGVPMEFVDENGQFDPETVFIVLSQILFHPLIGGFLLAAILAAIMSTISSQLLVASSSLTEDFYKLFLRRGASDKELVMVGRISVILVALVAILLAYDDNSSVLDLVANAWAGFGAAFGPVIIISLHWRKMTMPAAFLGMVVGAVTVIIWTYLPLLPDADGVARQIPLNSELYSIVPGFLFCWLTVWGVSLFTHPKEAVIATHDAVHAEITGGSA
ncbi:proline/sodium symporter [Parvularcula bermudensis HTCC2503]|uniref:Sodium/proline symporter n=1 Tax=Parvularcula bermudensis (strain ATCC BAA-594 / HTCC2503 / KCTC 12087) TaxID=314260 RepID=E0TBL4_PARBH|nr:sodium/proline symporter PutP [Parvularcula bermudensis]ADM08389.1 proline/sodium symporter [Parvularcula bermudensis HTCC2503]